MIQIHYNNGNTLFCLLPTSFYALRSKNLYFLQIWIPKILKRLIYISHSPNMATKTWSECFAYLWVNYYILWLFFFLFFRSSSISIEYCNIQCLNGWTACRPSFFQSAFDLISLLFQVFMITFRHKLHCIFVTIENQIEVKSVFQLPN